MDRERATAQLAEAVEYWLGRLALYGLAEPTRDVPAYVQGVIADLCSEDEGIAAEAALTVADWEPWVDHRVMDVPAVWWGTDLGGLVLSAQTSGEMSVPDAMAALGISRTRVYQLLEEGPLTRGRMGGVTRRSVARRLDERE